MIGIVDTSLVTGREDLAIVAYRVDSTFTAIDIESSGEIDLVDQMTQEEFDELALTPPWNHSLIQDEGVE